MTVKMSTAMRNYLATNAIAGQFGGSGIIELRTGAQPASANLAPSGTLLVFIPTDAGWSAAAVAGKTSLLTPTPAIATASGTAGWARLICGGVNIDGSVGMAGSGADFIVNATTITSGLAVSVAVFSITLPM